MAKILIIESCEDCKHYDNSYYDYNRECMELHRVIPMSETIPTDCPLLDAQYKPQDISFITGRKSYPFGNSASASASAKADDIGK
jgi:hypothetical protein